MFVHALHWWVFVYGHIMVRHVLCGSHCLFQLVFAFRIMGMALKDIQLSLCQLLQYVDCLQYVLAHVLLLSASSKSYAFVHLCHIPYDQPSQLWCYSPLSTPLETNSSTFLPRTYFQTSGHVLGFPLIILHFGYPLLY